MKKIKFLISTVDGNKEVSGWIIDQDLPFFQAGTLAIHKRYTGYNDYISKTWVVSHIPTGYGLGSAGGEDTKRDNVIELTATKLAALNQKKVNKALKSKPIINQL